MSLVTEAGALLRADIARFIRGGPGGFEALAMRLFRWQLNQNADYRAMVGDGVASVTSVAAIPCVPVALWRDLSLVSFPVEQSRLVFRTSGTTGRRGAVHRLDTELYDLGARRFAESVVGPIPAQGVSLVPDAVDSSLGHMCRTFSPDLSRRFAGQVGVDVRGAVADLQGFSSAGVPVFVPGTALALAALVAGMRAPIPQAQGSVVMVTGGFKGKVSEVPATGLRSELVRLLPGAKVVEEYGMTELSSQMWSDGPGEPLQVPPWMRVLVVDPGTGKPARRGLLRFIDLANVDTVLAIETGDEGTLLEDGRLILHGRLQGAPARGCSLTVEEAMGLTTEAVPKPREPSVARVEGAIDASDVARVRRIVAALDGLPEADLAWGQGLTDASVRRELQVAIKALTVAGLTAELSTVPASARPANVTIVAAEGVFTAALEWVVLCLAAGIAVRWKPPRAWPHFAGAVGSVLGRAGFPVLVDPAHDLGTPAVIVAFGSDAALAGLRRDHPAARIVGYGHRFGMALVQGQPTQDTVQALLTDHLRYATRGCMAPAGVGVVDGDPMRWLSALADGLTERAATDERGDMSPSLGPEWRRRLALSRATLGARTGRGWAVAAMQAEQWIPSALPWFVSVFPIASSDLPGFLEAHAPRISVLGRPTDMGAWVDGHVGRGCPLGTMQSPPFPRLHDGLPMLARICAWRG